MPRDLIWLTGFALVILAIVMVINTTASQKHTPSEIRNEPQTMEKAA